MQLALFGGRSVRWDPAFTRLRRRDLDQGAWIDHAPGWLGGHERLFEELSARLPWRRTTQILFDREVENPRRLVSFPEDGPPPPVLLELAEALSARYRVHLDQISAALYRGGDDSVAWHRDREHRERARAVVAIVSLGNPRRFLLRPYRPASPRAAPPDEGEGTRPRRSIAYSVGWGDLLVMGGTCQRTWEHAVPKTRRADPRIALMFRHHPDALRPSRPGAPSEAGEPVSAEQLRARAAR